MNDNIKYRRIRDMREDRDISQATIAEYLNIRQNTYSRYETNAREITLDIVMKLADYYGTSVDYLLNRTDVIEPYPKAQ